MKRPKKNTGKKRGNVSGSSPLSLTEARKNKKKRKDEVSTAAETDVKAAARKTGKELLDQVIHLTGIPASAIRRELKELLKRKNLDPNQLTVDQLRLAVASYLREIMGSVLERSAPRRDT